MKTVLTILAAFITSVAASPAIVWNSKSTEQIHNSEVTELRSLVESELPSVVFVVERDENGSEGLTELTASGSLPKIASKYAEAASVNHFVRGISCMHKVAKDLGSESAITLENYEKEAATMKATVNDDGSHKVSGNVSVVSISKDSEPSEIDSIVSSAIENANIGSVVLTSIRGLSEVKFERNVSLKQEYVTAMQETSRRRLEDAGDDGYYNKANTIYFVNYTPNIFSGVLFFFFFAAITYTGIGCMGQIAGQDLYVTKYPTIGREA